MPCFEKIDWLVSIVSRWLAPAAGVKKRWPVLKGDVRTRSLSYMNTTVSTHHVELQDQY